MTCNHRLFLNDGQGYARKTTDKFKACRQADDASTDNDNSNLRRDGLTVPKLLLKCIYAPLDDISTGRMKSEMSLEQPKVMSTHSQQNPLKPLR
jgi:hypothetical protein